MSHPHLCIFIMSTFTALSHHPSFLPGNHAPLDTKQRWANHYSVPRRNIIKAVSGQTIAYFRGEEKDQSQSEPAVHVHALSKAHLPYWLTASGPQQNFPASRILLQKRFFFLLRPSRPHFVANANALLRCSNNDNIMLVLVIIEHFMAHSLLLLFLLCNSICLSISLTLCPEKSFPIKYSPRSQYGQLEYPKNTTQRDVSSCHQMLLVQAASPEPSS